MKQTPKLQHEAMILVSLLRKSLKALRKPTVKIKNWKSGTPADPTHVTLPWPFNKPNCVSPLVWFQHGRVETGGTGWVGGGLCGCGAETTGGYGGYKRAGTSSPLQELLVGLRAMITGCAQSTGV